MIIAQPIAVGSVNQDRYLFDIDEKCKGPLKHKTWFCNFLLQ
jgi:hypothetical protein